jgi:hypothetical protein
MPDQNVEVRLIDGMVHLHLHFTDSNHSPAIVVLSPETAISLGSALV